LSHAIHEVESNDSIQGLVLSSSLSSIFCAGLDMNELYQPNTDRLVLFWTSFQQVFIDLYGSRLACMAAVNGHAIAGGCMLALSCDYRIMVDNKNGHPSKTARIGLNESAFGLLVPPWMGQQYIDTLGHRRAEMALSLGALYRASEALSMGLVDDVVVYDVGGGGVTELQQPNDYGNKVSSDSPVIAKAKEVVQEWIRIPPYARVASKKFARQRQIDQLLQTREADIEAFCASVMNERTQDNLGAYLASLSNKKKNKPPPPPPITNYR
jgi:Delta3-Delta2-enoyl-CoA isomerase